MVIPDPSKGRGFIFLIINEILMENIINIIITTGLPAILAYLAGSWKRNRQNEASYIKNLNQSMEAYSKVIQQMEKRYDTEIKKLEKRIEDYEERIREYEVHIDNLQRRIKELENELNSSGI